MTERPGTDGRRRYLLFRVDDRLLHGQVVLGWGSPLGARAFLLADDRLAADPGAALLYEAMAPEGSVVRIASLDAVGREAGSESAPLDPARTILVVRSLHSAARLIQAGVSGPLNLGGIHLRPGAREVLPYLFLTPEDVTILRTLAAGGDEVYAQDLPRNPRHPLATLLSGPAGDATAEPAG